MRMGPRVTRLLLCGTWSQGACVELPARGQINLAIRASRETILLCYLARQFCCYSHFILVFGDFHLFPEVMQSRSKSRASSVPPSPVTSTSQATSGATTLFPPVSVLLESPLPPLPPDTETVVSGPPLPLTRRARGRSALVPSSTPLEQPPHLSLPQSDLASVSSLSLVWPGLTPSSRAAPITSAATHCTQGPWKLVRIRSDQGPI